MTDDIMRSIDNALATTVKWQCSQYYGGSSFDVSDYVYGYIKRNSDLFLSFPTPRRFGARTVPDEIEKLTKVPLTL